MEIKIFIGPKNSNFLIYFYIYTYICKCILWQVFNEMLENQELYWNRDDFRKNLKQTILIF